MRETRIERTCKILKHIIISVIIIMNKYDSDKKDLLEIKKTMDEISTEIHRSIDAALARLEKDEDERVYQEYLATKADIDEFERKEKEKAYVVEFERKQKERQHQEFIKLCNLRVDKLDDAQYYQAKSGRAYKPEDTYCYLCEKNYADIYGLERHKDSLKHRTKVWESEKPTKTPKLILPCKILKDKNIV